VEISINIMKKNGHVIPNANARTIGDGCCAASVPCCPLVGAFSARRDDFLIWVQQKGVYAVAFDWWSQSGDAVASFLACAFDLVNKYMQPAPR